MRSPCPTVGTWDTNRSDNGVSRGAFPAKRIALVSLDVVIACLTQRHKVHGVLLVIDCCARRKIAKESLRSPKPCLHFLIVR